MNLDVWEPDLEASGELNLVDRGGLGLGWAGLELKRVARGGLEWLLGVFTGGSLDSREKVAPGKGRRGRLMRSARSCNKCKDK